MPEVHVVLIAGGSYQESAIPTLHAPYNDLRMMVSLLRWRYQVPLKNILVVGAKIGSLGMGLTYVCERATYKVVQEGLRRWAAAVKKDDFAIGYFSGHGVRIANAHLSQTNAPLEWNALVCADYEPYTGKNLLLEHELWAATERLATPHRTWILDCCFGGGFSNRAGASVVDNWPAEFISKGLGRDYRPASPSDKLPTPPRLRPDPVTRAPFTLLAACQESEVAQEARFHSRNGQAACAVSEFTWALYHTLWRNQKPLTLTALEQLVTRRLGERGRGQTPLLSPSRDSSVKQLVLAPVPWSATSPRFPVVNQQLQVGCLAGIQNGQRGKSCTIEHTDWFQAGIQGLVPASWLTLS